jgi:predicted metal-dependent hydrolase
MSLISRVRKALKPPPRKMSASVQAAGHALPVEIILNGSGIRYSMTARKIILRLPGNATVELIREQLGKLEHWVQDTVAKRPDIIKNYIGKEYVTGSTLTVGQRTYTLDVKVEPRDNHTIRLLPGGKVELRLSEAATSAQRTKSTRKLLAKIVANDQRRAVTERVLAINAKTVQRPVRNVTLKYNSSNWGSCSSKSNINLSVRLLFAPQEVQDYVILHELAHLIEQNHSDRFWAIVEQYMPDYKRHEKWLSDHGKDCDF